MYTLCLFLFVHLAISTAVGAIPNALPYRCTVSLDWVGSGYTVQDCSAAIMQFFGKEVVIYRNKRYEFVGENAARAHTPLVAQYLPMRFTVGK